MLLLLWLEVLLIDALFVFDLLKERNDMVLLLNWNVIIAVVEINWIIYTCTKGARKKKLKNIKR